jgi:hypothetical protein
MASGTSLSYAANVLLKDLLPSLCPVQLDSELCFILDIGVMVLRTLFLNKRLVCENGMHYTEKST